MGTKAFFDGVSLTVLELPDRPLPSVLGATPGENFSPTNPLGLDPDHQIVDAARLDNLRPTDGALPPTKFPDRVPGTGEGAGVGQPSGQRFHDVWENNPARKLEQGETQSGPVGSGLAPSVAAAAQVTEQKLRDAWTADRPAAVDKDREERLAADFRRRHDVEEQPAPPIVPQEQQQSQVDLGAETPEKSEYDLAVEGWNNKDAVRESIKLWGGEDPHAAATREELEEAAQAAWDAKQLA